tara:strand:+ start:533 stop:733 length:201 start_codon:yes stop_codon:yes gene_type:complete
MARGKRLGRKLFKSVKKGGSILRKSANVTKSIIGQVDKLSGGALTKALNEDPRTRAMLTGVDVVAN